MRENWALTVSELNEYVRKRLAGDPVLRAVEVTGEISGYKHHVSGHRYFSLKDESARVQCVMLRPAAQTLSFVPGDGMRVTAKGSASLFVRDGSYQLYVNSMRVEGAGELYLKFEALKKKLAQEGLFDPARKRPIPMRPRVIGVATSETGAAIRDILRVARSRDPRLGVLLAPCAVQGASAAQEIVSAIERLNADGRADVLLVGRGGGSMEDLWPFNEEIVARAIAASGIPVISCVGHEIDFTIADFAADLRAATPSNAAELAVPVRAELLAGVEQMGRRLSAGLSRQQQLRRSRLERISASAALSMPGMLLLDRRANALRALADRLAAAPAQRTEALRGRLELAERSLTALDPGRVVSRGYALIVKDGKYVKSRAALHPGESVDIRLADGVAAARIEE